MNTIPTNTDAAETHVDARFAGGHLTVAPSALPHDQAQPMVRLSGPGIDLDLFPHEADALAAALQRATPRADHVIGTIDGLTAALCTTSSDQPPALVITDGTARLHIGDLARARALVRLLASVAGDADGSTAHER